MADLPPELDIPAAWYGPDMAARSAEWTVVLSPAEIAEIEAAAAPLAAREADIAAITAADFPLLTLAPRLKALREALIGGRGFVLLRGLPVERWSRREAATAYFGLGTHLGRPRPQNARGHVLGHVCDLGLRSTDANVRIYQTNERQTFHTDSADVVGLLCLQTAKRGGASLLVSAVTIFNEMRKRRPDLARLLFAPLATDRRGEVPDGARPYYLIPVLSWHRGHLTVQYQRQYIDSAQRFADAPVLSPAQIEALDLFDALSEDPALHLAMEFRPGDIQLVYNHALMHDRTAFEDWPEPWRRRHLLRLWLALPGDRPLPAVFAERYGSVEIGNRGGITLPGTVLNAPLDPA